MKCFKVLISYYYKLFIIFSYHLSGLLKIIIVLICRISLNILYIFREGILNIPSRIQDSLSAEISNLIKYLADCIQIWWIN